MKRIFVLLIVISAAVQALAAPTVKYLGVGYKGTYTFPGVTVYAGEMKYYAQGIDGVEDGQFISFCIEANEHVYTNNTYDAIKNTAAWNGGIGGGNPDPLGNSTAWLYNNYLDNVVGSSNNTIALDYQMAIWYLEEEIPSTNWSNLSANAQGLVNTALTHCDWENNTIRVLNLYKFGTSADPGSGDYFQDCLIRVTSEFLVPTVPAPSAIMLGGLGVAAVGAVRRKKA